jgi:hypothetical protein
MTYRSKVLLLSPAAIAGLTALIYAANRHRKATALLSDIRNDLKESVAETRALHRTLRHQRHPPLPCTCDKRVLKTRQLNPISSTAGSHDPAVPKGVPCGTDPLTHVPRQRNAAGTR